MCPRRSRTLTGLHINSPGTHERAAFSKGTPERTRAPGLIREASGSHAALGLNFLWLSKRPQTAKRCGLLHHADSPDAAAAQTRPSARTTRSRGRGEEAAGPRCAVRASGVAGTGPARPAARIPGPAVRVLGARPGRVPCPAVRLVFFCSQHASFSAATSSVSSGEEGDRLIDVLERDVGGTAARLVSLLITSTSLALSTRFGQLIVWRSRDPPHRRPR